MAGQPTLFLVIDQGGHASRAAVFEAGGRLVVLHEVPIETLRAEGGRVEHDPEILIESLRLAVAGACRQLPGGAAALAGAGIATQRSSIVCWDRHTGAALSPVLSWQDTRTAGEINRYAGSREYIHALTGLPLSPHYGATKIRWCLDHIDALKSARLSGDLACGPLSSFILFRLLAERPLLVDPANASRTLLWNYRAADYEPALLELFGIPRDILPRGVPNYHDFGHLVIGPSPVPVTVVTGDQSAALHAFGRPRLDTTYINMGTGAFLQRPLAGEPGDTGPLLGSVAWQAADSLYVLEGTVNGAGSALARFAADTGMQEAALFGEIGTGFEQVKDPPLYLNGISGLGSPWWQADFPSCFTRDGGRIERLIAVVESIAFLIKANLDEMADRAGRPATLLVTGGLSSVDGLCRILAELAGAPVQRPAINEATARGVAFLLSGVAGTDIPVTVFEPGAGDAVRRRYRRWLEEMNACVDSMERK